MDVWWPVSLLLHHSMVSWLIPMVLWFQWMSQQWLLARLNTSLLWELFTLLQPMLLQFQPWLPLLQLPMLLLQSPTAPPMLDL